jgi:hypothetical protein
LKALPEDLAGRVAALALGIEADLGLAIDGPVDL